MSEFPQVLQGVIRDHDEFRAAFRALVAAGMNAGERDSEAVAQAAVSLEKRLDEINRLVEKHVRKEEQGVFPVLRIPLSAGAETGNTIFEVLEAEHRHLEKALASLTSMCDAIGSGGNTSSGHVDLVVTKLRIVEAEFLAHFVKEEQGVYSRAGEVLTEDDRRKIERALDSM